MTTHQLKTWPEYFQASWDGLKPWELRKDDRTFRVGDELHLREFDPKTQRYTGRNIHAKIEYILPGGTLGLPEDMCILSMPWMMIMPPTYNPNNDPD